MMRTAPFYFAPLLASVLVSAHATAAELKPPPRQAAAPLLACPEYGPGFFKLPGHDICLKASIDVTYEMKADGATHNIAIDTARALDNPIPYYFTEKLNRMTDRFTTRVDPRVSFMTVSRIGDDPVITYTTFRTTQTATAATSRDSSAMTTDQFFVDQAWVKYAGFTAGRHPSLFNFTPGYTYSGGYASQHNLNMFSYTHTFGKVASLAVSVEDASERRVDDFNPEKNISFWASYSGQRMPDIVAQARYLPSWGIVHAAGALHQINDAWSMKSSMAYAANAGVEYRQKWVDVFGQSAADTYGRFLFNGAYTSGALSYLGIPRFGTDYVSDVDGKIVKTRAYAAVASYEHVWKPNFKTTLSYSVYSLHSDMKNVDYRVKGSLAQFGAEYMPVPGLMVGTEVNYFRDSIRATQFGVSGERDKVDILTGIAYIRRRI